MTGMIRSFFGVHLSRKSQVERLQGISDEGLISVEDSLKDRLLCRKKSKRGRNYEMKETFTSKVHGLTEWTTIWKEELTSGRRQAQANDECAFSFSDTASEMEGDICNRMRRWDIKTGKEIKGDLTQTSSETVGKCPDLFVNKRGPPKPTNIYACQSYMELCDPALVMEDVQDSGGFINHVTLNLSRGNAWEKATSRRTVKSTVSDFFSRLHRTKKTKVMRIRI